MTAQQHPAVFIGLDVGKAEHHAVALTAAGKKVYDKALPNDETRLRGILDELARAHGPALLVVDQPATIGALPVAVAQACDGVEVAYLPGWRCDGSLTCTPARPRPTPRTRRSSLKQPARCPYAALHPSR